MYSSSIFLCTVLVQTVSSHPHLADHATNSLPSNIHKSADIQPRDIDPSNPYATWPSYSDLPLHPTYPTKAAWGVWGPNDTHGALNHINSSTIQLARSEIQLGQALNLNLELQRISNPINSARKPLSHLFQPGEGYTDDVVVLNTQISTQYDGLRHFPYSVNNSIDSFRWYNDHIASYDEVIGPEVTSVLGIQEAAQKGIVARGVLLDFAGYAEANRVEYDAFTGYAINVSMWDAVAAWQGLEGDWSRPGDILLVRTGWLKRYSSLNATEAATLPWTGTGASVGFEASNASLEWLWNKKLALVGADNPAFESTPFGSVDIDGVPRSLHQVFIAGWGQSIMEFLDLEELAARLRELKRSTFFLTVQNLNVVSGIASPPNAMAIL